MNELHVWYSKATMQCTKNRSIPHLSVAAGSNKEFAPSNETKLDRETEELHLDHVSLDVSKLIQQGRQAKGLTKKELAIVSYS